MNAFQNLKEISDYEFQEYTTVFRDTHFLINGSRGKDFRIFQIRKNEDNIFHIGIVISNPSSVELAIITKEIGGILIEWQKIITVNSMSGIEERYSSETLLFSNHIYLITDKTSDIDEKEVTELFQTKGWRLIIQDSNYRSRIFESRQPDFFLCHDSRDKESVARPLFQALEKRFMKVWFDEAELEIGDSLTEKIQFGIKNCKFGILILSKNFLSNERWAKYELQSLQTKQIINNEKILLPIWHEINEEDLKKYSLWLVEKFAGNTSEGIERLASKLARLASTDKQ